MSRIEQFLADLVQTGGFQIGQIAVSAQNSMCHVEDVRVDANSLAVHESAEAAIEIARWDSDRNYRPLKSAPNLVRGWLLRLQGVADLRLALDYFYPAAIGMWVHHLDCGSEPVPFRDTLNRQTGMYRITQLVRDDQAIELIQKACNSGTGCLRRILWPVSKGEPHPLTEAVPRAPAREIPILCTEACNLLVAACRPLGKQNLPKTPPAQQ